MGTPPPFRTTATAERVRLGRRLFFDPILSIDRTVSCASCHDPRHGFASPVARPPGVRGRRAARNAPTLLNRAYGRRHSWDGRAASLEEQVLLPITNPLEMDLPLALALERVRAEADYGAAFETAFGRPPDTAALADALALFIRTLMVGDSPVDRFRAGNAAALTARQKAGLWIFESKGGCWRCHSGDGFTDEAFHNTGVGVVKGVPEDGRVAVTGRPEDHGRFKTPTLRALTLTAPYMHDGSLATLEEVVAFYRRGGGANRWLDPALKPLDLSEREAADLVAFLEALSPR